MGTRAKLTRRRFALVLLRAAAWGLGVALGVAGGGWLTVVSGSGAPGAASLDTADLVTLPLLSAAAVFAVVALAQLAYFAVRSRIGNSDPA